MVRSSPMSPSCTSSLARCHWGWWRYMKASITFRSGCCRERVHQLLAFGRGQADRLFAQHVLARLQGLDRPGHVQVVGQRIVDRLDLGIGQQLLVGAIGLGNAQFGGRGRALSRFRDADGHQINSTRPAAWQAGLWSCRYRRYSNAPADFHAISSLILVLFHTG